MKAGNLEEYHPLFLRKSQKSCWVQRARRVPWGGKASSKAQEEILNLPMCATALWVAV